MVVVASVLLWWFGTPSAPPMPGDKPNKKLVELFNAEIDALGEGELNSTKNPGLLPTAPERARQWFSEIREVVTHCRYGSPDKANWSMYDITLQSGEAQKNVIANMGNGNCRVTPMRVRFEDGRVVEVTTDGSELQQPLESARGDIRYYLKALISRDAKAHPERYYKPTPAAPKVDLQQEWAGH